MKYCKQCKRHVMPVKSKMTLGKFFLFGIFSGLRPKTFCPICGCKVGKKAK